MCVFCFFFNSVFLNSYLKFFVTVRLLPKPDHMSRVILCDLGTITVITLDGMH